MLVYIFIYNNIVLFCNPCQVPYCDTVVRAQLNKLGTMSRDFNSAQGRTKEFLKRGSKFFRHVKSIK